MSAESKEQDLGPAVKAAEEILSDASETDQPADPAASTDAPAKKKKKKKSKTKKLKDALTGGSSANATAEDDVEEIGEGSSKASKSVGKLLDRNPALKNDLQGKSPEELMEALRKLGVGDLLTGTALGAGGKKDLATHKFWSSQPVPKFEDFRDPDLEDGPMEVPDMEEVLATKPAPLPQGFEWVILDLTDDAQLTELYDLLSNHYVEDGEAMFRFNYSKSFLNWVLKTPGWKADWHLGVRATVGAKKLLAFISAIPVDLHVRKKTIKASEVNFLCVHKKLRDKRLAPVLIAEITRACFLKGVFQAIYTAGVMLPGIVSTCRYFHRSLDWERLYDLGFSHLPPGSTKTRQTLKFKLPSETKIPGTRIMEKKDVPAVRKLLQRYLNRFAMRQQWTDEELEHWIIHNPELSPEQVIWAYVVEDPVSKKITDFYSFYRLESSVLQHKGQVVKAAYMFYYATEAAFDSDKGKLKVRLNELIKDMLILAKKAKFDVLNALTLLDNPLFLEQQLFGQGDGLLHYYLYNYKTRLIPGGINGRSMLDDKAMGGVGVVML